jgi:hypothetical protein
MSRCLAIAMSLLAVWAIPACYNTSSVENGGLQCGAGNTCPDGFTCRSNGQCWRKGTGPSAEACAPAKATAPYGPFPSCNAQAIPNSTCDPVCQSGCPCDERCILTSSSTFVCEGGNVNASFIPPFGTCNEPDTNLCAPGAVCIADSAQRCPNLCYKTCRVDVDCPAKSRCTRTAIYDNGGSLVGGVYLCSPPVEACNPTGAAACNAAAAGFKCVFLAGLTGVMNTDETVCDCESMHAEAVGSACSANPDTCQPGAVCINEVCRTVCTLGATGTGCPSGYTCAPIYNSSRYGYCRR